MAKSKEDVKYGAAQAKLSEDEMLRTKYVHGTPLEAGKIADAEPVDLVAPARRVAEANDASPEQHRGIELAGDEAGDPAAGGRGDR